MLGFSKVRVFLCHPVEMPNIAVYVSGCTETDTTGVLSPPTDGEYFELCKILREFPRKFREYYRMNMKTFDYILDSVRDDLLGYSNFRMCIEAEEKLTVALRYALVFVVGININYKRHVTAFSANSN